SKLLSVISVISPMVTSLLVWSAKSSRRLALLVVPDSGDQVSVSPGLQPSLGVDRGHAAGPRGGDRLAVGVVHHVPGGEDPLDARPGLVGRCRVPIGAEILARHNVPGRVELQ